MKVSVNAVILRYYNITFDTNDGATYAEIRENAKQYIVDHPEELRELALDIEEEDINDIYGIEEE